MCHSTMTPGLVVANKALWVRGFMPTDLAVAITRKREALKFKRDVQTILLGNFIVCLIFLMLVSACPALAAAVELLVID